MKKNISLLLFIVSGICMVHAQSAVTQLAETAPKGILVFTGNKIPNGVKAQSIRIERREDNGSFQFIAEVKAATSEAEFLTIVNSNTKYFPDLKMPAEESVKATWRAAVRTGLLDSLGYIGRIPAVRIALGLCYYDKNVKEKVNYQYQVQVKTGGRDENYTSNTATYPYHPKFDEAALHEFDFSRQGLYLRFYSIGTNPASEFKLMRYQDKIPVEVKGERSVYKVKDTTFYVMNDAAVVAGKQYQYSLVGLDKYGNTAYGSDPAIISTVDYSNVFFKKTDARRDKNVLGIQLGWVLNNASAVQSVHVYRSTDALKNFTETGSVRGTDTSFADVNVLPDKMYFYYLTARDRTGKEVKRSSVFFESAFDYAKPLTPQISSARGLKNGVQLYCLVPDKFITGIKVYRALNASENFEVITDFYPVRDTNAVTFTDTSRTLNGRNVYSYYIVSQNSSSVLSEKSNVVQVQPAIPTNPSLPAFFKAYYQDDIINLSWMDVKLNDPLVQGYLVWKQEAGTNNWKNLFGADSVFRGSHFDDAKYEEGKTYEYKIETVDEFGGKSQTAALATVSVPLSTLPPPAGLRGIAVADGVELEWSPSSDENVSGYKVYRYQRGSEAKKIGNTNASTRYYLDKTASKGELYFYYVTATDTRQRESEQSDEVGVRK